MKKLFLVLATVSALVLSGCAPAQVDVEAEKSARMEADKAWAESTGDPESFASFFAENGSFNAPGAPRATGREAIPEVFTQIGSLPNLSLSWEPTHAAVSSSGDLGYIVGTYELGFDGPDGKRMKEVGQYVTVWQKQADGSWKVIEDIFNNDAPAGGTAE